MPFSCVLRCNKPVQLSPALGSNIPSSSVGFNLGTFFKASLMATIFKPPVCVKGVGAVSLKVSNSAFGPECEFAGCAGLRNKSLDAKPTRLSAEGCFRNNRSLKLPGTLFSNVRSSRRMPNCVEIRPLLISWCDNLNPLFVFERIFFFWLA